MPSRVGKGDPWFRVETKKARHPCQDERAKGTLLTMNIGKSPGKSSPLPPNSSPEEWHVRVSVSVAENVPASILRTWIILESFARDQPACWPGNRALAARLGVKLRAATYAIEALEDHGIAERRQLPGNRRSIFLIRRTFGPMERVEWKALESRADRRAEGRSALAKAKTVERRRYKPPVKIVR
jgi:hypothetical protein